MTLGYQKYAPYKSVRLVSPLTTYPRFQANLLRIERTLYSVMEKCRGQRRPGRGTVTRWLNSKPARDHDPRLLEDPVEDVFVGNVAMQHGNFRIFMGNWQHNDHYLQTIVDCLDHLRLPESTRLTLSQATIALLKLSDEIAERLNFTRWWAEESTPGERIILPELKDLDTRAQAMVFSRDDLANLGIDPSDLTPFILDHEGRTPEHAKSEMNMYFEKYPLLAIGDQIAVISPHDISPAIRHYTLTVLAHHDKLRNLVEEELNRHKRRVEEDIIPELRPDTIPIKGPFPRGAMPPLASWIRRHDTDMAIHFVLISDIFLNASTGFDSVQEFPINQSQGLSQLLVHTATYCLSADWCNEGFTILLTGGVGRSIVLPDQDFPLNWHCTVVNIYDLLLLADRHDNSVERYLKLVRQKHQSEIDGVAFPPSHLCEDICLYSYWANNNYYLVEQGSDIGTVDCIIVSGAWTRKTREESRSIADRHVEVGVDGAWRCVKRFSINSYFRSRSDHPTYVDLESLSRQVLCGVTTTHLGSCWLRAVGTGRSSSLREVQLHLWQSVLDLLFSIISSIGDSFGGSVCQTMEIRLDFSQMASVEDILSGDSTQKSVISDSRIDTESRVIELIFGRESLGAFRTADDSGERELLTVLIEGLMRLWKHHTEVSMESTAAQMYDELFSRGQLRLVHLFSSTSSPPPLGPERTQVFLVKDEELSAMRRAVVRSDRLREYANASLDTVDVCNTFLHNVVEWYWLDIKESLSRLDRGQLIRMLLTHHDSIIADRIRWRIASRAFVAIHGSTDEPILAARSLERHRARTAVALRTLLEMAICECPNMSGDEVPQSKIDELIARVSLMLSAATHSDGIFTGLIKPSIQVGGDLSYVVPNDFYYSIVDQFTVAHFRAKFVSDVEQYQMWYKQDGDGDRYARLTDNAPGLDDALRIEYGLTLEQLVGAARALFSFGSDRGCDVVDSTVGELLDWTDANEEYSADIVRSFLSAFGLSHRQRWDRPPVGFEGNDIWPWRYSRRLSVTFRPVLLDGLDAHHRLYYSASVIFQSIVLLIDKLIQGHLPQEFAVTEEMKSFLGRVDDQQGSQFEESVADQFRAKGWEARTRVSLTEFGADGQFGDVDVLALHGRDRVMVVECKRLQLARTVKEIAETCQRFVDDESGQAAKHSTRVRWMREHPQAVRSVTGCDSDLMQICPRFVTSVEVPMKYLSGLPSDIGEVGPLRTEDFTA